MRYCFCLLVVWGLWAGPLAAHSPAQLCDQAAIDAAQRHGVPLAVLRAIARVETGRDLGHGVVPWPWAIQAQGRGYWPPKRDDALARARALLADDARNFDLGCFQINFHWHGHHFDSLDQMIDPAQNADYAARLLRSHYQRLGDWVLAAGAYHSKTPDLAQRYRARVTTMMARLTDTPATAPTTPPTAHNAAPMPPRENGFALLVAAPSGEHGSLVPVADNRARRAFISMSGAP